MKAHKVMIIAEAGVNHNGDIRLAKKLIDVAAASGADYVKFQTFNASSLASSSAEKAEYQKKNTGNNKSQLQMLQSLQLSPAQHEILIEHAKKKGIGFLSTPFDSESISLLKNLKITTGKIPSGEITSLPYLKEMAQSFKKIILSTGMSDMHEVKAAVHVLIKNGVSKKNITLLHCTSQYPAPFADVNLNAMVTLKKETGLNVGYSDHTSGIEVAIAAVALGAVVIEKHFTTDRNLPGPDHKASLEPGELKSLVQAIRNIEISLGSGKKVPVDSEREVRKVARKSIVALKEIGEGERFTVDNITIKRPGTGISPMKWDQVLGKKAKRNFKTDELITL